MTFLEKLASWLGIYQTTPEVYYKEHNNSQAEWRGETGDSFEYLYEQSLTFSEPILVYPKIGAAKMNFDDALLVWEEVYLAVQYTIQYSTDSNTMSQHSTTASANSVSLYDLLPNTTYYWRVKGTDFNGVHTDQSEIWSFKTLNRLDTPDLLSPTDEQTDLELPITLEWDAVENAQLYKVEYGLDSNDYEFTVFTEELEIVVDDLTAGETYSWTVTAINGVDANSSGNSIYEFTVAS